MLIENTTIMNLHVKYEIGYLKGKEILKEVLIDNHIVNYKGK